MKVLFATYPMAFHTPGGGEQQLLAYQKHLPAHGVDVALFNPWDPCLMEYDLVHYFSCVGGSVHFCDYIKQLGIPLVISSSLWITEETKHQYPIGEISHQLSLADLVVANSAIECSTLSEILSIPRDKFVTVYNGVEDIFLQPVEPYIFRQHFGITDEFVLNVGNIEPRKNQLRLVETMKAFPQLRLALIGHVRSQEYLRQIMLLGGEQVVYLGPVEHASPLLRSAYRACELFALPSMLETPGLAALEAAAQGAELVLTSEGSCVEYFGEDVIYVNPGSTESIIDGVGKCLENDCANAESNITDSYLWKNTVGTLANHYRELLYS